MVLNPLMPKITPSSLAQRWLAALACAVIACLPIGAQSASRPPQSRGAYLAAAADCASCHTAGPKGQPFAGGLSLNSPFGNIYSSNITPDPVAGIGNYSFEDFSRALRKGIAKDGKRLYPAMPYPSFSGISDEDMHALYDYFMHEVKPVPIAAPKTDLPFPFNQRWLIRFWDMAFSKQKPYKPRPDRTAEWNRGAYLVQTLGHCGACHTPRGFAFQVKGYSEDSPTFLKGAVVDNWFAANLRDNYASGLRRWSKDDIVEFLQTGHGAQSAAFGSMTLVIENSTQYLHQKDLQAIALYLKSLHADREQATYRPQHTAPSQAAGVVIERPGAGVYHSYCAKCHQDHGEGDPPKFPRLAGSPMVLSANATSLIHLVLAGGNMVKLKHGEQPDEMPSYAKKLTDGEIADALTYIRNSWGNSAAPVTTREVSVLRKKLQP